MEDPCANPPFRGDIQTKTREEDWALLRGELCSKKPVVIKWAMGGAPKDIIWTTSALPVVVSDRFIEILEEERFTGWSTYPVRVYGKDGKEIPGYRGLAITGRAGSIDESKSELVAYDPIAPEGKPFVNRKGLYFDPTTWDGSDLFLCGDCGFKFIRGDVKRALERAKIRNVSYTVTTAVEQLVDTL